MVKQQSTKPKQPVKQPSTRKMPPRHPNGSGRFVSQQTIDHFNNLERRINKR